MAHCGRVCRRVVSVFLLRSGIFITQSIEHEVEDLKPTASMARFSMAVCGFCHSARCVQCRPSPQRHFALGDPLLGRWEADSSIPGLYPLDVSSSPHSSCNNQPCLLQTSPNGPWRQTGVTPTSRLVPLLLSTIWSFTSHEYVNLYVFPNQLLSGQLTLVSLKS